MKPKQFKIPVQFKYRYKFFGEIHPLRARAYLYDLGIFKIRAVFSHMSFSAYLELEGTDGKFEVHVHTEQIIEDVLSLRNLVLDHVESRINLLCFYQGTFYDAEVVSCAMPDERVIEFGVGLRALEELNASYRKRVALPKLMLHECYSYLSNALKDFKRGMQDPLETHFYVFRAVESVRVYFGEAEGLDPEKNKAKTWEILRTKLGYEREDFRFLEEKATARRHGQVNFLSEKEIVDCLGFGWKFLIRFIEVVFGAECIEPPLSESK